MKELILIRHAKSSWKDGHLSDFKRPLNCRGKRDAPFMGKVLNKIGIKPDLVLSSPAKRASDTAEFICGELGLKKSEIKYDEDIYEASDDELVGILKDVKSSVKTLILVGHNPGLTDLSNYLSDKEINNIPTTGIISLSYSGEWKEINGKSCTFNYFEYPKKYFPDEE